MRTKHFIYILAVACVSFACKTKQQVVTKQKSERKPVELLVEKLKQAEPQFNSANVSKMNVNFDLNGRSMSVSASCRLIKDSVMHISIMPALGIELFKVEVNRDSLHVFDKFNRRSYSVDYKYLADKFAVELNYQSVEALITNRFFIAGEQNPDTELMTAASEGLGSVINYKGNVMQQLTYSNELNRITKQNIVAKKSNYVLNALYDTFEPAGEIVFPRKINISVSGNRRTFNADFTINRVTFNENVQLQPIDRSRFTKASIDQLLKK